MMLSAMVASTGGPGTFTKPDAAFTHVSHPLEVRRTYLTEIGGRPAQ
jgi:hypothetical protein